MERLGVVRLTVLLGDQLDVEQLLLQDEANLRRDAKVGRGDQDDLLKHRVLRQLMRVLDIRVQLLLFHHVQMHHVANVQIEYPVLRVFDSERVPHVQLEALIFLNIDQLLERGEGDFQSLATVAEVNLPVLLDHILVAVDGRLLTLVLKLLDNAGELLQQWVRLNDQGFEHLDGLLDVDVPRHQVLLPSIGQSRRHL